MAEFSRLNGYDVKDKKAIRYYNTVADMKADTTLKAGMYVKTSGYYTEHDGGHAEYRIVASTTENSLIEDNGILHQLSNGLFAKLIQVDKSINIKQLGAKETGEEHNTNDIKDILTYAYNNFNEIIIPNGTYYLSEFIASYTGSQNKIIRGLGETIIYTNNGINFIGGNDGAYSNRIKNLFIKDIYFNGNNRTGTGLLFNWFGECYVVNCYFNGFSVGINIKNGSEMAIDKTFVINCITGINIVREDINQDADIDGVRFNDCYVSNCNNCIISDSVRGVSFSGCVVSNGDNNNGKGIIIKNTYHDSVNVNINQCEFENSNYPSIICGASNESYRLSNLNISQSKFVLFHDVAIELNKLYQLNMQDTVTSLVYPKIIVIKSSMDTDLIMNIVGCDRRLPNYIYDERTTFCGLFTPSYYRRLNYYPNMDRSISEFGANVSPTFDSTNNKVTFTNNGYIEFPINKENYDETEGIQVIVHGKHLGNFGYIDNNGYHDAGNIISQDLTETYVKSFVIIKPNISAIRINFNNDAELDFVGIYGKTPNALPEFISGVYTDANIHGNPKKGDTFRVHSANQTYGLITWNGSQFTGI